MQDKILFSFGAILTLLGSLWLFNPSVSWPLTIVAIGGVFLLAVMRYRIGALAIPGILLVGLGGLLFWTNLGSRWADWLYLWPLVPALVGLGLVTANAWGMPGHRVRQIGKAWLVQGLLMTAIIWLVHTLMPTVTSWPLVVIGLGIMLIITAPLSNVGALVIPGTILGGLGCLLYWQNLTGMWASWTYTWTLIPVFVGIGLVTANLLGTGKRTVRQVGLHMIAWSVVAFLILTFALAFGELFARLWPILLIVAGLWIVQSVLSGHDRSQAADPRK